MTDNNFLQYVATDIISKWGTDLSRVAVVFPNKRAALFMNEYLARTAGCPMWSPSYITISDLFRRHSDYAVADSIKLICDLHKSFIQCTGLSESLDHFYGWGQLLLADFDDIDKNMASADKVFCNLKDIHELDEVSYLSQEQRDMLNSFFANFSDDKNTELKKRFLSLWSHFADIYHDYGSRLRSQGLLYEGALYRDVVETDSHDFEFDKYIFIGFNLLQVVEQRLFARLKKMGKAHFYWDFDDYYMPRSASGSTSVAGHYIAMYLSDFPNELDVHDPDIYSRMQGPKEITYISASTENAQARYVHKWLTDNMRYKDGKQTAVVMCDESILLPVMHSLPTDADKVNITSGYPLNMTPIASLVHTLFDLYTFGCRRGGAFWRVTYVNKVLTHPYAHLISPQSKNVYIAVKTGHLQYPARDILTCNGEDEALSMLFSALASANGTTQKEANATLLGRVCDILKLIGINGKKDGGDALFQESVFRMYTILNRLQSLVLSGDLDIEHATLQHLVSQLITSTSVPFHGEPIVGLQIMGVLETRNIDFKHVLLLSCNEGNMPKGVNDSSFIPYSIRKAHGLTTIDNKVAIYSYYFHRLLQRATDITIMYNNATSNGQTGEMSRFMLQLMVAGTHTIHHANLLVDNSPVAGKPNAVAKTKPIMDLLDGMTSISPTAINNYLRCPLKFYHRYVAGIQEPDAADEMIDNRMFGNIFHKTAQIIYQEIMSHTQIIEKHHIDRYLSDMRLIARAVDRAFEEELFKVSSPSARPDYNGLQIINRNVIIEYTKQLLRIDSRTAPFRIIGLEKPVYTNVSIPYGNSSKQRLLRIGGFIDRLDMIISDSSEHIRVVDYKTGNQPQRLVADVESIFSTKGISSCHSDYYLQAFLYSLIVSASADYNPSKIAVSPALLFIKQATSPDYDPVLAIGTKDNKVDDIAAYSVDFMRGLNSVLADIFNPDINFVPTDDKGTCATCAYKKLCGV